MQLACYQQGHAFQGTQLKKWWLLNSEDESYISTWFEFDPGGLQCINCAKSAVFSQRDTCFHCYTFKVAVIEH